MIVNIFNLPRRIKEVIVASVDILTCVVALWLAFYLRLGDLHSVLDEQYLVLEATVISVILMLPIFYISGLYRTIFRYTDGNVGYLIAKAVAIYGIGFAIIVLIVGIPGIPRTIGIIQPIILCGGVYISRSIAKWFLNKLREETVSQRPSHRVLIYGAGAAGRQLSISLDTELGFDCVGFVDDDAKLTGRLLNGVKVISPVDLNSWIKDYKITHILVAIPSAPRSRIGEILRLLARFSVTVRLLPSTSQLVSRSVQIDDLEPIDLDDLLDREPLDDGLSGINELFEGQTILVTGAGGSIGRELCNQLLPLKPKKLILFDSSEYALYSLINELTYRFPDLTSDCQTILGSVQDRHRVDGIFSALQPDIVFHAAAYKHVSLVESNIAEAVKNNVFGTLNVAESALAAGASKFILISTDKAVRPTNVMGATKRLAEMLIQALEERSDSSIQFSMVRFGNVLASSGSVVPKFQEQIKNGGPITVTHKDVTRFFMTIPEAAQLVIQSVLLNKGGDVFLLDMGRPQRILDLARRLIRLSGLKEKNEECPDGDIEIQITGLSSGEKLKEELLIDSNQQKTRHPRIFSAKESYPEWSVIAKEIYGIGDNLDRLDDDLALRCLKQLVGDFKHENNDL